MRGTPSHRVVRRSSLVGFCRLCCCGLPLNSWFRWRFLAVFPLLGRAKAPPNACPSVGMADTMDRNIWDIMGEVKPTVNSGLLASGAAVAADKKSSSTKNSA